MSARSSTKTFSVGALGFVTVAALALSGCSSSSSGGGGGGGSSSPKVWTTEAQLVAAAKKEGGTLNLYMPDQYPDVMKGFAKAYPWTKVNLTDLVPQAAAQKWATELSARVHNVDAVNIYTNQFAQFTSQNAVAAVELPNDSNVPAAQEDPAHYFHTYYVAPYVLLYNTKRLSGGPSDLKDLTDPKWKGQLVMDNPALGGPSSLVLALVKNELGSSWEGWLKDLDANKPSLTDGSGTSYGVVVRGDYPLCLCAYHDYTSQAASTPVKADIYGQSSTGVAQQSVAMAIPTDAPHPAMAALWTNWLLSDAGQEAIVAGGRSPVKTSVPGADKVSLPPGTKVASVSDLAAFLKDSTSFTKAYKAAFG